jgi:shikimate dehydrogenase
MNIAGTTKVAGVMGWPVAHSLSPRLHGFWLSEYGIDGAYVPFAVPSDRLFEAVRALPALGLAGVNLTIPHKEAAMALVDAVDAAARRIGAINCIVVDAGGKLTGSNSDGYGFIESVREGAPGWQASGGACVVLGAGGAARAICVALLDAGAEEVRIINRTAERAEKLAADFGSSLVTIPWSDRQEALSGAALLVNATSLGMTNQPDLDIELGNLPTDAIVADIVYAPLETGLLSEAKQRGNPAVDGLGMLLHQARPAFASWFGIDPAVTPALRSHVLAAIH